MGLQQSIEQINTNVKPRVVWDKSCMLQCHRGLVLYDACQFRYSFKCNVTVLTFNTSYSVIFGPLYQFLLTCIYKMYSYSYLWQLNLRTIYIKTNCYNYIKYHLITIPILGCQSIIWAVGCRGRMGQNGRSKKGKVA